MKFLVILLLFCLDASLAAETGCDKSGHRFSVPGTWEPPEGTDPQWLTRNNTSEEFIILGAGSISIGIQIDRWSFTFSIQNFDFAERLLYYESGFSYFNDLGYTSRSLAPNGTRLEDFMVNERYPNATERQLFPKVIYFPLAIQPIIFTYNFTALKTFVVNRINDSIYLTVELLADIYLGYLTNWNDTRIRALNPNLLAFLPNQTIIPIGYSGFIESSTYAVTEAFWTFSERFRAAFPAGPFHNWPLNSPLLNPQLKLVASAFSTFAFVRNTPGGIGYMPYQVYKTFCAGARAPYVLYRDRKLRPILPDEDAVMRMYENIHMNHRFELDQVDHNITGWPMTSVTYIHFNFKQNTSKPECTPKEGLISKDRLMLMFFRWVYTNKIAQKQGAYNGVFIVPDHIRNQIIERIDTLTCKDQTVPILEIEIKNDHKYDYFDALFILSMILTGIMIPMCIVLTLLPEENGKSLNKIAVVYSFILLLGALLVYLSIIFFYLVPDYDRICQTRIWMFCLGASLFLGSIFTRTLQIHRIFRLSKRKTPLQNTAATRKAVIGAIIDFMMGIGISLTAQFIILIIQITSDPVNSVLSPIDEVERTASWVCKSKETWLWVGLEIGFFVAMITYGLWVVYRTWDLKAKFSEARWLLICIYNMLFTLTVIVAIGATIEVKDDTVFIMAVSGILFIITSSLLFIYVPKFGGKLQKIIFQWRSHSEDSSTSSSRTRSKTQSNSNSL